MNAIISIALVSHVLGQPAAVDKKTLPAELEKEVSAATVRVINLKKESIGNGVVIDKTATGAYVLTAGHIVDKSNDLEVRVYGPERGSKPLIYTTVKVLKLRTEDNQDLALLLIEGYNGPSAGLKICPKDSAPPKDKRFTAFFAACGKNESAVVRAETIEKSERVKKKFDDPISALFSRGANKTVGGESGGALVNAQGQLIGICSGTDRERGTDREHGYFCHLDEIHAFVRSEGLGFLFEKKKRP